MARWLRWPAPWAFLVLLMAGALVAPTAGAAPVKAVTALPVAETIRRAGNVLVVEANPTSRALVYRACKSDPCDVRDTTLAATTPIELDGAFTLTVHKQRVGTAPHAAEIVHVVARSTEHPSVAWEALVGAASDGAAKLIFAGKTGLFPGGPDDAARVTIDGGDVIVGELRRGIGMCGQPEALIAPRRLDAATMSFRAVALERLPPKVRDEAKTLIAKESSEEPIGSVLGARGATSNDGATPALVDGDASTAWTELRKGDGRGELVVLSAPPKRPLASLSLVVQPRTKEGKPPIAGFSQLRVAWLAVDDAVYRLEIPSIATPGARATVTFPTPVSTSCVSIEIESADESGDVTVGLAEVEGVPVLPASVHTTADLVGLLDVPGEPSELAREVLVHGSARSAAAIVEKLPSMGVHGKEHAVDILEAAPCEIGAVGLARLAWDAPKAVSQEARSALDACGPSAKDAIAAAFATANPNTIAREVLADRYAKLDPKGALTAITLALPPLPRERRRTLRNALSRLPSTSLGREALTAYLRAAPAPTAPPRASDPKGRIVYAVDPVIELARAIAKVEGMKESTGAAGETLASLLSSVLRARTGEDAVFERRYLAIEPLADLAAGGEAQALAALDAFFGSKNRYLRAHVAEVASSVPKLRARLLAAAADVDPRVRQRALESLGKAPDVAANTVLLAHLRNDFWTFVRIAAAESLALGAATTEIDAQLAESTLDDAPEVRSAAIRALSRHHAAAALPAVRKRAFDAREFPDVRREAVVALGEMCDRASLDKLQYIAEHGGSSDSAASLSLAAVHALGELHPADLAARLAGVDRSALVMNDAVRRAMSSKGSCESATPIR